jgi:hypothetical protein
MVKVTDAGTAATRFVQRAQAAAPDYVKAASVAGGSWATNTAAGANNWAAGVSQAVSDGRFAAGVNAAGPAKYQAGITQKGAVRYGPGVAAAQPAYAAGVGPYLQLIASLDLPPRGPTGSPANNARVNVITAALRAKKIGG